jgi:hypothetical protein
MVSIQHPFPARAGVGSVPLVPGDHQAQKGVQRFHSLDQIRRRKIIRAAPLRMTLE